MKIAMLCLPLLTACKLFTVELPVVEPDLDASVLDAALEPDTAADDAGLALPPE